MRNLIARPIATITTLFGTLLLTATGAFAQQDVAPEVPGGLRNMGPAPAPAHEVPGGLRNMGPALTDSADPVTDAAVAASSTISLTWMLALIAVTAVVAAIAGYGFRAVRERRTVGTVGVS